MPEAAVRAGTSALPFEVFVVLFLALFFGIVGRILVLARSAQRKRDRDRTAAHRELERFVASSGWTQLPTDPRLLDIARSLGLWSQQVRDVVWGSFRTHQATAFTITPHSNDNPQPDRQIAFLRLPASVRGNLDVRPRRHSPDDDPVALDLGVPQVEFESEEFNRTYSVHAADARFAYAVLTPQVMEVLLSRPPMPWRITANIAGASWPGEFTQAGLESALTTLSVIVEHIPAFAWEAPEAEAAPPSNPIGPAALPTGNVVQ